MTLIEEVFIELYSCPERSGGNVEVVAVDVAFFLLLPLVIVDDIMVTSTRSDSSDSKMTCFRWGQNVNLNP